MCIENNSVIRIDVHAHAVLSKDIALSRVNGTILHDYNELCDLYDRIGVTAGIIMPIVSPEYQSFLITSEDAWIMSKNSNNKLFWCCNIDPRMESYLEKADFSRIINHYIQHGAVGVGEITTRCELNDGIMQNLLLHCEECRVPVTIHWRKTEDCNYGVDAGRNMILFEKFLKNHPNLKIIGHSVPFWEMLDGGEESALVKLMRECPNLYCDTSANSGYNAATQNIPYFYKFLEEFQDRILFGLDISYKGETIYEKIIEFYDNAYYSRRISKEVYEKINYRNAMKLYNIQLNKRLL